MTGTGVKLIRNVFIVRPNFDNVYFETTTNKNIVKHFIKRNISIIKLIE